MGIANHNAIVVGGGPGGSTAATLLAKAGARVLLVEKRGGTFRWGKHPTPWTFDFGSAEVNQILEFNFAYQVERAKFDELLLNNARRQGVEVREETSVTDVIQEGGRCSGVTLLDRSGRSTEARATFIIDASGNQSRLHALAGKRVFSKFFQNLALFGYFEGGGRLPAPHSGNIFSCAFPFVWFWLLPLSQTLTSVGAVVAKEHAAKLRSGPDYAMGQFIDACPEIKQLLANATRIENGMYGGYRVRKDYSYINSRFWLPGLVLVGDSACFVDPIFSSGVHLATYSGMLAARSIATILKRGMPEAVGLDIYERRYRLEYSVFYDFLVSF